MSEEAVETPELSLDDISVFRERVDERLHEFVTGRAGRLDELGPGLDPLLDAAHDSLRGGKRLRAAFCYWGWRAAGGSPGTEDDDRIVTAAASVELLHASALVHDDVMDHSDRRRGQPAAHRQFSELHRAGRRPGDAEEFGFGSAILLGDLLLSWTDEMLRTSGFGVDQVMAALRCLDSMRTEVAAGQFLDLVAQNSTDNSVPQAMRVLRYKSAKYTVERPLHMGAALGGADSRLMTSLTSYGLPLGEAFQLRDDVLGVFGDPEVTGKPAGDDLREGKRTVLMALATERATAGQAEVIGRLFGSPRLDDRGVRELRDVVERTGARTAVEQLIHQLTRAATTALDQAPIDDPGIKTALLDLATAATSRTS